MPNKLSEETSPYLLQHANNPVEWYPWGPEALFKAKEENKLILVSIGYSACHWCHVMEHESFEDEGVAELMNKDFVCVKIDREERPDIDQIYMTAVQLMTNGGGWPLNCFCLPDQRPIYGGTYFRKEDWKNLLQNLADFWASKPEEALEYANRLTDGIRESEKLAMIETERTFSIQDLKDIIEPWKQSFDLIEGGYNRAPKFPLPNNWQFLLRYGFLMKDEAVTVAVRQTLEKMAFGGIYDQIGGGFARYSVDGQWHVPHFEKMLYDNAQLISLYAEAYQCFKYPLYKNVVYETIEWIRREMTSPEGGFYSALDADSEGVEGKFYTFSKEQLKEIIGTDEQLFSIYYNVIEEGNWEEEQTNILFRKMPDDTLASEIGISEDELTQVVQKAKEKVFAYREKRVRPGLDNKILSAWNAMTIKALSDAYRVFDDKLFLNMAIRNAEFILKHLDENGGTLYRTLNNSTATHGFLDDYAFVIEGLVGLYESTFNESWLQRARWIADDVLQNFYDDESGLFFYTSAKSEELIARKQEIMDNVIPSSNSVMAVNLFKLGHFFDDEGYLSIARQQLKNVQPHIKKYGSAYSNWADLLLKEVGGIFEIAITGKDFDENRLELEKKYIPNKILLGGKTGKLPLLEGKFNDGTKIYVCKNKTCKLPVRKVEEALTQLV